MKTHRRSPVVGRRSFYRISSYEEIITMITIQTETGKTRNAYLALPTGENGPGVLVLHAWWGLTDYFQALCDRLAAEGFVALAPDLYNGQTTQTIDRAAELSEA